MSFNNDIETIIEILSKVFGPINFTKDGINIGDVTIQQIDNEGVKQQLLEKVCQKIAFLYTKPIVDKELKTSSGILEKLLGKQIEIPFGVPVADKRVLPQNICNEENVKQFQEYFYLKLKILFYLTEVLKYKQGEKNAYQKFYENNRDKIQFDTKKVENNFKSWNKQISEIIKKIKSDNYDTTQLKDIVQKFTSPNSITLELCRSLTDSCNNSQEICVDDTNILSVNNEIVCKSNQQPEIVSKTIGKGVENEEELVNRKYPNKESFIKTVKAYFNKSLDKRLLPENKDEQIKLCIGRDDYDYDRILNNFPANDVKDELITNLLFANAIYTGSIQPSKDFDIGQFSRLPVSDINIDSIENLNKSIGELTKNQNENVRYSNIQLGYYCKLAKKKEYRPQFSDCNVDVINDSKIISTIGDGNCLIHAFLISTCPNYRRADTKTKMYIAYQFRQNLALNTQNTELLGRDTKIIRKDGEYLSIDTLNGLSSIYNMNILLFYTAPDKDHTFLLQKLQPPQSELYICMFFTGSHYSSVTMFDSFLIYMNKDKNQNQIINNYNEFLKGINQKYIIKVNQAPRNPIPTSSKNN